MPAPDAELLDLYRQTEYRVRLPAGGHAVIRIDARLPTRLHPLLPEPATGWGFITAWNPRSVELPRRQNRARQRQLLARLRALGSTRAIHAGLGIAPADPHGRRWAEASLFVIGPSWPELAVLQRHFEQHGIVTGTGDGPARLRT